MAGPSPSHSQTNFWSGLTLSGRALVFATLPQQAVGIQLWDCDALKAQLCINTNINMQEMDGRLRKAKPQRKAISSDLSQPREEFCELEIEQISLM